jgi:hypothetical protein
MDIPASDYDGAWKEALERSFEPFLAFFFPQVQRAIDWSRPPEFRDTELQQIAPEQQRGKQHVDKLVRVLRVDGSDAWVFVHIEVQSQYDSDFPERMFRYHARLFDRERQPIVSLAVLGDERPEWQPESFRYELWGCELSLRFPVAKLARFDTVAREADRSLFATIVLLHRDAQETLADPRERLRRKAARYRRVLSLGYTAAEIRQLVRLADRLLRLPGGLAVEAREAMRAIEEEYAVTFITSYEELARAEERRTLVLDQLTYKCGPLEEVLRVRVEALSFEELLVLSRALLDFTSAADLRAWLDQQASA